MPNHIYIEGQLVERIMGFKGGDCCSERTDNSRIIRLRKHFCEEDDER